MRQYAGARDGCGYGFRPPTTPTHIRLPRQCYHFKSFRIRYQTSDEVGQGLTKEEIEGRVGHAINLLRTSHKLLLNDPVTKPMGLVIWQAICDIPDSHKVDFVTRLSHRDIQKLWKLAGDRYVAPRLTVVTTIGPDYSLWKDMPKKDGEIVQFQGRLALPLRVPVDISRIEKEFVLVPVDDHHSPQSEFQEPTSDLANVEAEIVGKTQYSHLLQRLMPFSATSFFSATLGTCIIPETLELCDMQLSYNFSAGRSSPADRERVADKYQTEYARVAGPGVIVGVFYVEEEKDKDRSGLSTFLQKLLPEPLYFVAAIHRF